MFAAVGVILVVGFLWWLVDSVVGAVANPRQKTSPKIVSLGNRKARPPQIIVPLPKGSPVSMGTPILKEFDERH